MLIANVIYFSRTLTRDYRWIYYDRSLHSEDLKHIMHDYDQFEQELHNYSKNKLVVRSTERGLVLYTFEVTDREDAFSRKVLAIKGLSFSGFDGDIAKRIREHVVTFVSLELLTNGTLDINVDDLLTKAEKTIAISLDACLEYCRDNEAAHSFLKGINHFVLHNPYATAMLVNDVGVCKLLDDCTKFEMIQQRTESKKTLGETWSSVNYGAYQPSHNSSIEDNEETQGRKSLFGRIKNKRNNT